MNSDFDFWENMPAEVSFFLLINVSVENIESRKTSIGSFNETNNCFRKLIALFLIKDNC